VYYTLESFLGDKNDTVLNFRPNGLLFYVMDITVNDASLELKCYNNIELCILYKV